MPTTYIDRTHEQLHAMVLETVKELENDATDGAQYLKDEILDIEFILDAQTRYIGADVLTAFGGPGLSINTREDLVIGYWADDRITMHYDDACGFNDACEAQYLRALRGTK